MKNDFDQFESDRMINDLMNYKWGVFYFNRKDPRFMVPKRNKMMGWTLNFAHRNYLLILISLIALSLIIGWLSN